MGSRAASLCVGVVVIVALGKGQQMRKVVTMAGFSLSRLSISSFGRLRVSRTPRSVVPCPVDDDLRVAALRVMLRKTPEEVEAIRAGTAPRLPKGR